ncbi:hypothetical protein GIB67_026859 [Kingdonia uniflora]|uniref:Uncharacterized protein n=1 Tax=Kingdonia uniflora TaxID=39325 RepID=A0A7J7M861_9MAGN|nr:hypothetical protein GIB67_026859 [Kingdonia uniflora]
MSNLSINKVLVLCDKRLNEQLCALRSPVPHVTNMNNKAILSESIVYLKGIIGETKKEEAKLAALATKDQYLVSGINETQGMSEVLIEDVPESGTEDRDYEALITYKKLQLAARAIVAIENPQDIIVQSARPYDQRVVLKFAQYAGAHPIAGSQLRKGCLFWLLARMVSQMCGTILPSQKLDVMVNLFFYIEPEETKEQEEEVPVYTEGYTGPPGFLWRLRHSILASNLILVGVEWTAQPVTVAAEAGGNGWDDAPAPLIVLLFDVQVFGKDKNCYIRGFGGMSNAELESTLPFRMKLANEKAKNTNLQSQLKYLGEQLVFEANARKQLEERFALFESRDSLRELQKRRTSVIEISSQSGCSPFANAYRPSMPVLPMSCELLDWYGATVAYGTLQQGGRASHDFYNILIDEIVYITENGPLEDVVAGEIIIWEKSCTVFI